MRATCIYYVVLINCIFKLAVFRMSIRPTFLALLLLLPAFGQGSTRVIDPALQRTCTLENIFRKPMGLSLFSYTFSSATVPEDCTAIEIIGKAASRDTIGDTGASAIAAALESMTSTTSAILTSLTFRNQGIGPDGAAALARVLMNNNNGVQMLSLRGNEVGDAGAAALAGVVRAKTALAELQLDNNGISDDGASALAHALKDTLTITALSFENNDNTDATTIKAMEAFVAAASVLKSGGDLSIPSCDGYTLGDSGVRVVAKALARAASNVTSIRLENAGIGPDGAAALAKAVAGDTRITALSLSGNTIGDVGATALASVLGSMSALNSLSLASTGIGDTSAKALAKALKQCLALEGLFLAQNGIGDEGASALADALMSSPQLASAPMPMTALDLTGNAISSRGATAFGKMLKSNSKLLMLYLDKNSIADDGAVAIAESLKVNGGLLSLGMGSNGISDVGASAVAEMLRANTGLVSVGLAGNKIGDAGAGALCEALRYHSFKSGGKTLAPMVPFFLSDNDISADMLAQLEELVRVGETRLYYGIMQEVIARWPMYALLLLASVAWLANAAMAAAATRAHAAKRAAALKSADPPAHGWTCEYNDEQERVYYQTCEHEDPTRFAKDFNVTTKSTVVASAKSTVVASAAWREKHRVKNKWNVETFCVAEMIAYNRKKEDDAHQSAVEKAAAAAKIADLKAAASAKAAAIKAAAAEKAAAEKLQAALAKAEKAAKEKKFKRLAGGSV